VVIQEIFRAVRDRLANEGYIAIAPSIFDRVERNFQCGYSPEEVTVARKFVANPDEIPGAMRSLSSGRALRGPLCITPE